MYEALDLWRATCRSARALAHSRGFATTLIAIAAVTSFAVAIIFSVIDAAVLQPLFARGQRDLVVAWASDLEHRAALVELSYPDAVQFATHTRSLMQAAEFGSSNWEGVLLGAGNPIDLPFAAVSGSFFDVLRVKPLLGRALNSSDDQTAAPTVLVISERLWRDRFGGNPDVIGRAIVFDRHAMTIVGVMGPDATFPSGAQAWVRSGHTSAIQCRQTRCCTCGRPDSCISSAGSRRP